MADHEEFNRQVRRTAVMTLALAAALVFGLIVLASGDWIPGGIIVAATLVALARELTVIRQLCSGASRPSSPKRKRVS